MAKNAADFVKDLCGDAEFRDKLVGMPLSEAAALVEAKGYSMTAGELTKALKNSIKAIGDGDLLVSAGIRWCI